MKDTRIKVCIRSRPLLPQEREDIFVYSENSIKYKTNVFPFDQVFSPSAKTQDLFASLGRPLIQEIIKGYNGTMLAYGQTTSGKTHTMLGKEQSPGLIQLCAENLFESIQSLPEDFKVLISYLEVYNEMVNDLLEPHSINLKIREDPTEGCYVQGLKQVRVSSASSLLEVLATGEKNRRYRATNIHDHSSRSHTVFKLTIESKAEEKVTVENNIHVTGKVRVSVLNLVDLAGSERLNDAGGNSETAHINKSLFVLANVINKLSENLTAHIPYRDSKLTRLLSNSLGGNAYTAIICTVAPDIAYWQLSLSTLRFAMRAKSIKNQPIINEMTDNTRLLDGYKLKCTRLETSLKSKDKEIEKLKEENARMREGALTMKFVNVSEMEFAEKYKELQKNFERQIEAKNALASQLEELKSHPVVGFDLQKTIFERKHNTQHLPNWSVDCQALRDAYLIELASLDKKYYGKLEDLFSPQKKKRPVSRGPTTGRQTRKQPEFRIRQNDKPRRFVSVRKPQVLESDSENSEFPDEIEEENQREKENNEEKEPTFNPNPAEKAPTSSYGAIEVEETKGDNIFLFGLNNEGSCSAQQKPVDFTFLQQEFTEIVCGYFHNAVLTPDKVLYTFGKNNVGQLGVSHLNSSNVPVLVAHPLQSVPVESVACGWLHTLCVTHTGEVYAWGSNVDGQLGTNDNWDRAWPVKVPSVQAKKVFAGRLHSACLSLNNELFAWGCNPDGRIFKPPVFIKHGSYQAQRSPFRVELPRIEQVALGATHSVALSMDGFVYTSGSTEHGQLGIGPNYVNHTTNFRLPFFGIKNTVKQIGCGDRYTCVLVRTGKLFSFGKGSFGRLGLGDENDRLSPCPIKLDEKIMKICCGGRHSLAIGESGEVFAWGYGYCYQLGTTEQDDILTPRSIDLSSKTGRWGKEISCGFMHSAVMSL